MRVPGRNEPQAYLAIVSDGAVGTTRITHFRARTYDDVWQALTYYVLPGQSVEKAPLARLRQIRVRLFAVRDEADGFWGTYLDLRERGRPDPGAVALEGFV